MGGSQQCAATAVGRCGCRRSDSTGKSKSRSFCAPRGVLEQKSYATQSYFELTRFYQELRIKEMQHFIYYRFSVCICSPQFVGLHPKIGGLLHPKQKSNPFGARRVLFIGAGWFFEVDAYDWLWHLLSTWSQGRGFRLLSDFSNLLEGEIPMMLTITSWPGRFSLRKKKQLRIEDSGEFCPCCDSQ